MQTTNDIWTILGNISVGTIVSWGIVIAAVITAVCAAVIKLYKVFDKTRILKDENDDYKRMVKLHSEQLDEFGRTLKEIKDALDEQKEVNLRQLRHEIVSSCERAIMSGQISTSALASLEEMYDEYKNVFHGNGYVKTLIEKVRKLEIDTEFET